jgi:hypothetical protein
MENFLIEACNAVCAPAFWPLIRSARERSAPAKLALTSLQHPSLGGSVKTRLSEAHSGRLGETARTAGTAAPNLLAALPFPVALSGRDAPD